MSSYPHALPTERASEPGSSRRLGRRADLRVDPDSDTALPLHSPSRAGPVRIQPRPSPTQPPHDRTLPLHTNSQLKNDGGETPADAASSIIGQFGVGFYSAFMVGETVVVESKPASPDLGANKWTSDGTGTYNIAAADASDLQRGCRITINLKDTALEFADSARIKDIITKYSNFVNFPIKIDGEVINTVKVRRAEPSSRAEAEPSRAEPSRVGAGREERRGERRERHPARHHDRDRGDGHHPLCRDLHA